jgi:hypothetical protein
VTATRSRSPGDGDSTLVELVQAYVEAGEPIEVTAEGDVVEADLADPARTFAAIVYAIPLVTAFEGDPPPRIDFTAELADLQVDQRQQVRRPRRWWYRGRGQ